MSESLVIDISYWQQGMNYAAINKNNVKAVLLRCAIRGSSNGKITEDKMLATHINGLRSVGIPIGFYFFSAAVNAAEGKEEAEYTINLLKKYNVVPYIPLIVDSEYGTNNKTGRADKLAKSTRTTAIISFLDTCHNNGYEAAVYTFDSFLTTSVGLDREKLKAGGYKVWVANYGSKPSRYYSQEIAWQYTNKYQLYAGRTVDCSRYYLELSPEAALYNKNSGSNNSNNSTIIVPTTNTNVVTSNNPYKEPTSVLKKGAKGDSVKWLQFELNESGANLTIDGSFGNATYEALKKYQKGNNLAVDGICGPATRASLKSNTKSESIIVPSSGQYMYNGVDYSPVFSPTYYSTKYVDIKNAFGNDTKKLFNHFCTNGMKERRQAIASFNVDKYMNYYADLRAAFGTNYPLYYWHYCTSGKKEGRKAI